MRLLSMNTKTLAEGATYLFLIIITWRRFTLLASSLLCNASWRIIQGFSLLCGVLIIFWFFEKIKWLRQRVAQRRDFLNQLYLAWLHTQSSVYHLIKWTCGKDEPKVPPDNIALRTAAFLGFHTPIAKKKFRSAYFIRNGNVLGIHPIVILALVLALAPVITRAMYEHLTTDRLPGDHFPDDVIPENWFSVHPPPIVRPVYGYQGTCTKEILREGCIAVDYESRMNGITLDSPPCTCYVVDRFLAYDAKDVTFGFR